MGKKNRYFDDFDDEDYYDARQNRERDSSRRNNKKMRNALKSRDIDTLSNFYDD